MPARRCQREQPPPRTTLRSTHQWWEPLALSLRPAAPPGGVTRLTVPTTDALIAMLFAAAVVPVDSVWLALSLLEVSVMDPLLFNDAVNPRPADDSHVLRPVIELTLLAPAVLLIVTVVAAPAAGVKVKDSPLSELVPPLVRSAAVPATFSGAAPAGAAIVAEAFTV